MEWIWLWCAVIVIAVIVEALTAGIVSVWFIPGALVAAVLAVCKVDFLIQVIAFVAVSIVGVSLFRSYFMKHRGKDTRTNIDAILGEKCIVTERIDNYAGSGQAKVKGQIWSARSADDEETFEPGEILRVASIEGVKLICEKDK